jgi:predicted RecB family nuclease
MRTDPHGGLLFSATDLANFASCERLTALERDAALGSLERPHRESAMAELLSARGDAHELAYLEKLRETEHVVVEIPITSQDEASLRHAEQMTLEAMRSGADVIYQATFFDGSWGGRADFLRKVGYPSDLGPWSYEIVDTKLARNLKPEAVLQLCEYAVQVERLQGRAPQQLHVVLGTGEQESIRLGDVRAYHRRLRRRFLDNVGGHAPAAYPIPVNHCDVCRWKPGCDELRRSDDHLSLVARMRRDQIEKLNAAGINTVVELAQSDPTVTIPKLPPLTFSRLQAQAKLQLKGRQGSDIPFELLPFEIGRGFGLLPEPSPGDIFFDIEGDPLYEGGGLEYLLGVTLIDGGQPQFRAWRVHDRDGEKRAFEEFIDFVAARLEAFPGMHVYHYADYEKAAMKRLMARYATRELEVDRLLRGEIFVDLYAVVRGAIRLGAESYSLKTVEHLYMPARTEEVKDATSSIVEYERWRMTGESSILEEIERYNQVDCESTLQLRDWLEQRRAELVARGDEIPRPDEVGAQESEQARQTYERNVQRAHALMETPHGGLDKPERRLLAAMLDWHQREDRPRWWEYFRRLALSEEELIDDTTAIGGLIYRGEVGVIKQSQLHEFSFPRGQEHKLTPDTTVMDPRTRERVGVVDSVDDRSGVIVVRNSRPVYDPPRALVPSSDVNTRVLRDAVARMVDWVLENGGEDLGPYDAGLALLRSPLSEGEPLRREGEDVLEAAKRVAAALHGGVLPIQGPPGSGKTYVGARVVVDLVRRGERVGITGPSHRAITNLVNEVVVAARAENVDVRLVQKSDTAQASDEMVRVVGNNAEVDEALADRQANVVAGTPWLFARAAITSQLSVLVVDEAGQVPLANALAVCGAARSMILLGDPQQLAQPAVGAHPEGSSPSALEHVLGEHQTMPPSRGLFLDTTWRMHPGITAVVSELSYEGRLQSHSSCSEQKVSGDDALSGSGVRFVAVDHSGNRVASDEEVHAVAQLVDELTARQWCDRHGVWRDITVDDIVIVAPFNAHVARLSGELPGGARIGSVDRFQGQEAAVVIFTMGTSSADDAPRGLEFVFNLNRLNVAISRGRALSIVVASPRLLDAHCRTAEQIKLVNALCRYVEVAAPLDQPVAAVG